MYQQHFKLNAAPFQPRIKSEFYFQDKARQAASWTLDYIFQQQSGIILITGRAGVGKSELITQHDIPVVSHAPDSTAEYLRWILAALGQSPAEPSPQLNYYRIIDFLIAERKAGRAPALAIDNFQRLNSELITELIRLSDAGLQLVLLGSPELFNKPAGADSASFVQRIANCIDLQPFAESDTAQYIQFRLQAAGAQTGIFSTAAMNLIARASGGLPRVINQISDSALLFAMADGLPAVDVATVEDVIEDRKSWATNKQDETI